MTEKLYLKDQYIKEIEATVLEVIKAEDSIMAVLDKTILYPEGGGQPSDRGYLGDVRIIDVQIKDGRILHFLESDIDAKKTYTLSLDWKRRFNHMQQHLGQHILSAALKQLFEARTVGFHLSEEYVSIDLDKKLEKADVEKAERLANAIVFENRSVEAIYPSDDEIKALALRKEPKVTKDIRIISVDEFDLSPCGGTHPALTGEIGMIKVKKSYNYKSGIRIEFICGGLALDDFIKKSDIVSHIANDLSSKENELLASYSRLKEELSTVYEKNKELRQRLMKFETEKILNSFETVGNFKVKVLTRDDLSFDDIKSISSNYPEDSEVIRIFSTYDDVKKRHLLLIELPKSVSDSKSFSAKQLISVANDAGSGKGGGSDKCAQSSFETKTGLDMAISSAKDFIAHK